MANTFGSEPALVSTLIEAAKSVYLSDCNP